mmetsp:Transcript_10510/g.25832  ORF Transcript_10510/g.25832 Transcript_10510/m.25832 type:complete len:233 (+) Transcript_10510:630-1328(+)
MNAACAVIVRDLDTVIILLAKEALLRVQIVPRVPLGSHHARIVIFVVATAFFGPVSSDARGGGCRGIVCGQRGGGGLLVLPVLLGVAITTSRARCCNVGRLRGGMMAMRMLTVHMLLLVRSSSRWYGGVMGRGWMLRAVSRPVRMLSMGGGGGMVAPSVLWLLVLTVLLLLRGMLPVLLLLLLLVLMITGPRRMRGMPSCIMMMSIMRIMMMGLVLPSPRHGRMGRVGAPRR